MGFKCWHCGGTHVSAAEGRQCAAGENCANDAAIDQPRVVLLPDGAEFRPTRLSRGQKAAQALERVLNPSEPEALLWALLDNSQISGFTFVREKNILGWFVDFYCEAARTVIEVDGGHHRERTKEDNRRDEIMIANHYRVLRFSAYEVMTRTDSILSQIKQAIDTPRARNRRDQLARRSEAQKRRNSNAPSKKQANVTKAPVPSRPAQVRKGCFLCLKCARQFFADVDAPVECRLCRTTPVTVCNSCRRPGKWVSLDMRICHKCAQIRDVARSMGGSGVTPQGPLHNRRGRAKKIL